MKYPWEKEENASKAATLKLSTAELRELLIKEEDIVRELKQQRISDSFYISGFIVGQDLCGRHTLVDLPAIKKVVIEELERQLGEVTAILKQYGLK